MKILVVTRALPIHKLGGMEVVAWDLAKAFHTMGHEVVIMTTPDPKGALPAEIEGIRLVYVNCPSGEYSIAWWMGSRKKYRELGFHRMDVVLSVSAGGIGLPLSFASKNQVSFAQIHGTAVTEIQSKLRQATLIARLKSIKNMVWMLLDFRYRIFDGFIAVGETVHQDIQKYPTRLLFGPNPKYLINNGISAADFSFDASAGAEVRASLGIPQNAKVGICASRLHEQKGVAESIKGFSLTARNEGANEHLIVAGDGPEREAIESLISTLHLSGRVHLVGRIDRKQLSRYFSAANYFLFTTKRVEGLPMSVLEALAAGLDVVVSPGAHLPELPCAPVAATDAQGIAQAIDAIQPRSQRASLLPRKYTLEAVAESYLSHFSAALKARG